MDKRELNAQIELDRAEKEFVKFISWAEQVLIFDIKNNIFNIYII